MITPAVNTGTSIVDMQRTAQLEAQVAMERARTGLTGAGGDTVSISEQARAKLEGRIANGDDAPRHQYNDGLYVGENFGSADGDDDNSKVAMLRRKIEQAKERLQDAQERLSRTQSKAASSGEQVSGAEGEGEATQAAMLGGMAAGGAGSEEVKGIQNEIRMINNELVQLTQQLQEAIKEEG